VLDIPYSTDAYQAEVKPMPESKEGNVVSFTTGPSGQETHWKQVVFLLREPIVLEPGQSIADSKISLMDAGSSITGRFYCKKSSSNSRELDVEIHYCKLDKGVEGRKGDAVYSYQAYKIR